jgi:hypothetical protein
MPQPVDDHERDTDCSELSAHGFCSMLSDVLGSARRFLGRIATLDSSFLAVTVGASMKNIKHCPDRIDVCSHNFTSETASRTGGSTHASTGKN